MTDFEKQANNEIEFLKTYAKKLLTRSSKNGVIRLWNKIVKQSESFKDKDGNNISDFLIDNAKDNHNYTGEITKLNSHDVQGIVSDTIKAIQGNTNTLLNE